MPLKQTTNQAFPKLHGAMFTPNSLRPICSYVYGVSFTATYPIYFKSTTMDGFLLTICHCLDIYI